VRDAVVVGGVVSARLKFAVIVPVPCIVAFVDANNWLSIVIVPVVMATLQLENA
jgi:Na+/H+ antiporter NhaC